MKQSTFNFMKTAKVYRNNGSVFIEVPESHFLHEGDGGLKEAILNSVVESLSCVRSVDSEFTFLEELIYAAYNGGQYTRYFENQEN